MSEQEKALIVIDDKGNEIPMEIVYIYEDELTGKKYVFYYDPNQEEAEVFVSGYDDEGNLIPIEDPDEWQALDTIFEAYVKSQEA